MDTDILCKKSKGRVEVVAWRVKQPLAVPAFHTGAPASVLASISHSAFRQHSRRQQVNRLGTPVLTRHAGDPDGVPVSTGFGLILPALAVAGIWRIKKLSLFQFFFSLKMIHLFIRK